MQQSTFSLILFRALQVSVFLGKLGCPREIQKHKKLKKIQGCSLFFCQAATDKYKSRKMKIRCESEFLGKPGCLGETEPPRSLADHYYATVADPADAEPIKI